MSRHVRWLLVGLLLLLLLLLLGWRMRASSSGSAGTSAGAATGATSSGAGGLAGSGGDRERSGTLPSWFGQPGQPGRTIAGQVFVEGIPAAAQVRLHSMITDVGAAPPLAATTDAQGKFDLGIHRRAAYRLLVQAKDAAPWVEFIDSVVRDTAKLQIFLKRCAVDLEGDIYDSTAGRVVGASVELDGVTVATSDDKGHYRLCLDPDGGDLAVRAAGYGTVAKSPWFHEGGRLNFMLVPEAILEGTVVDGKDQPVAGALVELGVDVQESVVLNSGVMMTAVGAVAVTDASGRFSMRGLASAEFWITARADGLVAKEKISIAPAETSSVVLRLGAGQELRGQVVDLKGTGVAGVHLTWRSGDVRYPTVSEAGGAFQIRAPDHDPGTVEVAAPYQLQEPTGEVVLKPGGVLSVVVVKPAMIRGRVLEGGAPLPRARVNVPYTGSRGRSDGEGMFEIPCPRPGKHEVQAISELTGGFGSAGVECSDDRDSAGVVIDVVYDGSISGVVVDGQGKPVPGAWVQFEDSAIRDFGNAYARRDGSFRVGSLEGGSYVPMVLVRGHPAKLSPESEKPILVADGKSHVQGVKLVVLIEDKVFAGKVVDADGSPVADALVMVGGALPTYSSEDGTFSLSTTREGPFTVEAQLGMRRVQEELMVPRADLVLKLGEPATIKVSCTAPVDFLFINGSAYSRRVHCGDTVGPLLPGLYAAAPERWQFSGVERKVLAPGETWEVKYTHRNFTRYMVHVDWPAEASTPDQLICRHFDASGANDTGGERRVSQPARNERMRFSVAEGTSRTVTCTFPGFSGTITLDYAGAEEVDRDLMLTPVK